LLICLSGTIVYLNSLGNSFVWDDELLVTGNPSIRSLASIPSLFLHRLAAQLGGNFYRPVQLASYAVDYSIWGYNPAGYHLTNLLIHLANAVILFLIILNCTGRRTLAFLTGLFFVIHPVQTEAVAYISGRADILSGFFILVSLLLFVRSGKKFTGSFSRTVTAGSLGFFILALLTREAAVILPLLALLCGRYVSSASRGNDHRRILQNRSAFISLFLIALVYLLLRYLFLSVTGGTISSNPYPFSARFLSSFKVILNYFKILLLPSPLRMERVIAIETHPFSLSALPPLLLLTGLAVFTVRVFKRSPPFFFGIAWFFAALLPYLNWFPLNAEMAEHWLYLPSAGFFFLLAWTVIEVEKRHPIPTRTFLILIVACWAILTVDRNRDWKNNLTIYTRTARDSPGSPRANYNLGNLYLNRGDPDRAVAYLKRSRTIKPGDFKTRRSLGKALLAQGDPERSIEELKVAVSIRPSSAEAWSELGVACSLGGRHEEAIKFLQTAVELDPGSARIHNNLASVYTRMGNFAEALIESDRALELDPDLLEARFNRGVIHYHRGDMEKARTRFRDIIRTDPAFRPARIWLEKVRSSDQSFF